MDGGPGFGSSYGSALGSAGYDTTRKEETMFLKAGKVLGPGPFGTGERRYDTYTAVTDATLIKLPRESLYKILSALSTMMLDYDTLLSFLDVPGTQLACRKVK